MFAFKDSIVCELSRLLFLQQLFSLLGPSFTPLRSIRHGSSVDAVWFALLANVYRCLCEVHYCWSGSDSAGGISVEPLSGSIGKKCTMLQYLEGLK